MEAARHSVIASTLLRLPMDSAAMITRAVTRRYHACMV